MSRRELHKIAKLLLDLNGKIKEIASDGRRVQFDVQEGQILQVKVRDAAGRILAIVGGDGRVETL